MATGIRLITRVGNIINIDATDFTMDFKRGVASIPVPATGERVAADMNLVTASIRLNAILRDDDCAGSDTDGVAASATLDFGSKGAAMSETEDEPNYIYMAGDGGGVTAADLDGEEFSIRTKYLVDNTTTTVITVKFDNTTSSHSVSGMILTVGINGILKTADKPMGEHLADRVYAAMTGSGTFGSQISNGTPNNTFQGAFTVEQTEGTLSATGSSVIILTQKDKGISGNTDIKVWSENKEDGAPPFKHDDFSGGQTHTCKSAGDKAQDLIANVANSNVMGAVGEVFQVGGFSLEKVTNIKALNTGTDDYIIGIQIPYNSLIQATLGATGDPQQGYATRNHLIVTGMTGSTQQGSEGNSNATGIKFDVKDPMTGIRGTVVGLTLSYDAGNTTYDATIDFAPIDLIAGL